MWTSSWMNSELQAFREQVRRFVATELTPHQERFAAQQHVDREIWTRAGELGVLCADIPAEYGGAGGTFAHQAVLFEEQAYAGDTAMNVSVHVILAHYILNQGTEAQKQRFLPRMSSGELIGAIAMSEPGAGSDLQGIRTTARLEGDHYVVNGSKTFISNGYLADLMVVVCRTSDAPGSKGISLLLVETKDAPGFKVGKKLHKLGQKGNDTCELFFEDVKVPKENLLGEVEGRGFGQLMTELPYERLIIAVYAVAAIERAVDLTVAYTKERKAFGKTLLEFQNTRFKLAEAKTHAVVSRTFLDKCIEELIAGRLDTVTASMAKYWTSDLQCQVIDDCLQLFGGYGYTVEYPIAQMFADARVQRIYGGANEIMKELIARSL
ncbi:MAG: acyl-CoA dehydrogenase family protein [Labilithrix sp.]|nr:acyl-CoA dehydrogenase family protein [Labilithrix sp.]MCW5809766.1 acyl-CoA dehydrogenase family protein [Labilithrix sp.]